MKHTCYLSIGSNLKNRALNIKKSIINLEPFASILHESHVYETPPWGYSDKSYFLNVVVKIETSLSPFSLLDKLKFIEKKMGRQLKSNIVYQSRIIDLDILFFGNKLIETNDLIIPHPRLYDRKFVLVPLCEIDPDLLCPLTNKTILNLLKETRDQSEITIFKK